jgi:hypothetical protein
MNRSHTLPAAVWPTLTEQALALISDEQFAQAGVWSLQHVRMDLPLALAQAPQSAHQRLRGWLDSQRLPYLLTGARREDVALYLEFQKIP